MPNFKDMTNSISELLNVFEDPAQRGHTIAPSKIILCKKCIYKLFSRVEFMNSLPLQSGRRNVI